MTKKTEQICVNVSPDLFARLSRIAEIEDRPLGYIVRELAIRGLDVYRQAGSLSSVSHTERKKALMSELRSRNISEGAAA